MTIYFHMVKFLTSGHYQDDITQTFIQVQAIQWLIISFGFKNSNFTVTECLKWPSNVFTPWSDGFYSIWSVSCHFLKQTWPLWNDFCFQQLSFSLFSFLNYAKMVEDILLGFFAFILGANALDFLKNIWGADLACGCSESGLLSMIVLKLCILFKVTQERNPIDFWPYPQSNQNGRQRPFCKMQLY